MEVQFVQYVVLLYMCLIGIAGETLALPVLPFIYFCPKKFVNYLYFTEQVVLRYAVLYAACEWQSG